MIAVYLIRAVDLSEFPTGSAHYKDSQSWIFSILNSRPNRIKRDMKQFQPIHVGIYPLAKN